LGSRIKDVAEDIGDQLAWKRLPQDPLALNLLLSEMAAMAFEALEFLALVGDVDVITGIGLIELLLVRDNLRFELGAVGEGVAIV
jgi:hypothetical protein